MLHHPQHLYCTCILAADRRLAQTLATTVGWLRFGKIPDANNIYLSTIVSIITHRLATAIDNFNKLARGQGAGIHDDWLLLLAEALPAAHRWPLSWHQRIASSALGWHQPSHSSAGIRAGVSYSAARLVIHPLLRVVFGFSEARLQPAWGTEKSLPRRKSVSNSGANPPGSPSDVDLPGHCPSRFVNTGNHSNDPVEVIGNRCAAFTR